MVRRVDCRLGNALTYAIIGDDFPAEMVARANGALNVLQFGWAFAVQYGMELILEQWPLEAPGIILWPPIRPRSE
ncbi:hypothetical protein [Bradyrhizobium sp. BR 1432]|uniref:hypothetical protein n=1 Tax=Bradyrhizobium sp. BR 1432 TaxID=3447966 RepID=UPI003EE56720